MMSVEPTLEHGAVAVPPTAEAFSEVAAKVAAAYPGLYRHQQSGVAFLLSRYRAILADDMGLGKTRQAIIALREAAPSGALLIICPAGVKLTWLREIRAVEGLEADVLVVGGGGAGSAGSAGSEVRSFASGHRWTVVNYDLLGKLEEQLQAVPWAGVIVDEAHYIKNDSQRSQRVLRLLGVDAYRSRRTGAAPPTGHAPEFAYLLTGTPMSNRPRDLFNLLRAVRHPLGENFFTYATRYCAAVDNGFGLDTNGASNLEELAQLVSGVLLRRTKDDALDLPPKVRVWQPVEAASEQVGSLEARALDYLTRHPARGGATWVTFLGLLNRARHANAVAKVKATIEAVADRLESEEKVVVFTSYTAVVDRLVKHFRAAAVSITGSHSSAERQAAADALQNDPAVRVLVGNLQAAGVGLTLTAASHVVFNDLDWVPGNHWQAEDRIYRIGQTKPAFVTYLYAEGTLDDFVAALLEAKARNIGVLETEAAQHASLVQQVVDAAGRGDRPSFASPAQPQTSRSVGLLEDTLDLLARARRGLAAADAGEQEFQIPSSRLPGTFYTVTIAQGIARCSCTGFEYRGNCFHTRQVVAQLSSGT